MIAMAASPAHKMGYRLHTSPQAVRIPKTTPTGY